MVCVRNIVYANSNNTRGSCKVTTQEGAATHLDEEMPIPNTLGLSYLTCKDTIHSTSSWLIILKGVTSHGQNV